MHYCKHHTVWTTIKWEYLGGFFLFQKPPGAQFIPKVDQRLMLKTRWSVMWLNSSPHPSQSRGPRTIWTWQETQLSADISAIKMEAWMCFLDWVSCQWKVTSTAALWSTKLFNNHRQEYGVSVSLNHIKSLFNGIFYISLTVCVCVCVCVCRGRDKKDH